MNVEKDGNKYKLLEGYWEPQDSTKLDYENNKYPTPSIRIDSEWNNRKFFLIKLQQAEKIISGVKFEQSHQCLICNKSIDDGEYRIGLMFWRFYYQHYLELHDIKPTTQFEERIFSYQTKPITKTPIQLRSKVLKHGELKYLKITSNQLMIMDALMSHGGHTKKYLNQTDPTILHYSEHSGMLDFDGNKLEKLIVSGKEGRLDEDDDEIYQPETNKDMIDFEYIFHTHPPTPSPGARAIYGVLYEFPSISDIFHFLDHQRAGITQGSLVVAPEGLYNIRKHNFVNEPIKIDEDKFFTVVKKAFYKIQEEAIAKYGHKFTEDTYHDVISKDTTSINKLNEVLNKFDLQIDFFPRKKDSHGNWRISDTYLPVFPVE